MRPDDRKTGVKSVLPSVAAENQLLDLLFWMSKFSAARSRCPAWCSILKYYHRIYGMRDRRTYRAMDGDRLVSKESMNHFGFELSNLSAYA